MRFNTKYHGIKEYEEKDIIKFEKGIPGFEELKKFILFPVEGNEVFNVLHSVENEEVGVAVVSPFTFLKEYEFELDEDKMMELQAESHEELLVLNIVTLNSRIEDITINLKAPIVINIKNKLGEQIILDNSNYAIRYPLF